VCGSVGVDEGVSVCFKLHYFAISQQIFGVCGGMGEVCEGVSEGVCT